MDPIMFGGVILAFVLAVSVVATATRGSKPPGHLRVMSAVFLLAVAAFCIFGFLATFEPPGEVAIRIVYIALGTTSVIAAGWLLNPGKASPAGSS